MTLPEHDAILTAIKIQQKWLNDLEEHVKEHPIFKVYAFNLKHIYEWFYTINEAVPPDESYSNDLRKIINHINNTHVVLRNTPQVKCVHKNCSHLLIHLEAYRMAYHIIEENEKC